MEYLIKPNGDGLFAEKESGQAMIDSRTVAEVFEKQHKHVLEAIEKLKEDAKKTAVNGDNRLAENSADYSKDINDMFVQTVYKDSKGRKQKCMQ